MRDLKLPASAGCVAIVGTAFLRSAATYSVRRASSGPSSIVTTMSSIAITAATIREGAATCSDRTAGLCACTQKLFEGLNFVWSQRVLSKARR